jgi:hypothetical protein
MFLYIIQQRPIYFEQVCEKKFAIKFQNCGSEYAHGL